MVNPLTVESIEFLLPVNSVSFQINQTWYLCSWTSVWRLLIRFPSACEQKEGSILAQALPQRNQLANQEALI